MKRQQLSSRSTGSSSTDRDRGVQSISEVLASLMAQRGYGRVQGAQGLESIWREACGALAEQSRPGNVQLGKLEVIVAHSALLQELSFRQTEIVQRLQQLAPECKITGLKLRLGQVG